MSSDPGGRRDPTVMASEVAFRGRIFDVAVERLRFGSPAPDVTVEVVRHVRSVCIVAMPSEGEVMLVRQYRRAAGGWMWELPAGSVDGDESPRQAAGRECHEELGLVAGALDEIGELFPLPGYCTELMTFFRATDLRAPGPGDPAAHQDEDEDIEAQSFAIGEIRRMLASGELTDMKAAAALALLGSRRPGSAS